jgi:glycosyltransferase involved in cell wall biosynthesis
VGIPPGVVDRITLVDDGSLDGTAALALSLDLVVISHPHNAGYGANQKTRYIEALRDGADVIVMLHPERPGRPGDPRRHGRGHSERTG